MIDACIYYYMYWLWIHKYKHNWHPLRTCSRCREWIDSWKRWNLPAILMQILHHCPAACNSQSDAVLLSDASQVTDSVIVLDSDCEADVDAAILSPATPTVESPGDFASCFFFSTPHSVGCNHNRSPSWYQQIWYSSLHSLHEFPQSEAVRVTI